MAAVTAVPPRTPVPSSRPAPEATLKEGAA